MPNTPDETVCPFCKGPNGCMAHCDTPCWCNGVDIPQALLELVPSHLKRKSCICLSCIDAYKQHPEAFTARYGGHATAGDPRRA